MTRLAKGAAVGHPAFGRGTVLSVRHNGVEARVSFGTFTLWVPVRELTVVGAGLRIVGGTAPLPEPRPERKPLEAILRLLQGEDGSRESEDGSRESGVGSRSDGGTRRSSPVSLRARYRPTREGRPVEDAVVLESFRLGIVPTAQIARWTVGRETEVGRIRSFLRDEAEGAVLIEGAYGAGKSHLLACLEQDAERLGYAVASAGFDPSEATAAFPKKAWRRIVRGFEAVVDGEPVDFRGFLRAAAARPAWREVAGDHAILAPILERIESGRVDEDDWDWIEARDAGAGDRPTLHDYSTCANIYCNLLSAVARLAVEVLGLHGLLVLLDEAEVARNVMYRYQALRGVNFFRGLVMTANDDHALLEEEVVREAAVKVGRSSGLIYSGHNPVRYTTGIPSHLKVAFALTPGSLQEEFRRVRDSIQVIALDVLTPLQLRDLFWRICDRFQSVTGIVVTGRDRERMFRRLATHDRVSSTRGFIKASIEVLDFVRFYPQGDVEEMISSG